jgi:2-amino-4-hydroxy-6-hydroxymethyldihydropteridine diphosphokinase
MSLTYLSFGSNLGDRVANIENGYAEIGNRSIGTVLRKSRFYETEPIGCESPLKFVNSVAEVITDLEPEDLLRELRQIEADAGRVRNIDKNSPRPIDIDILFYDFIVINSNEIVIPHREITKRMFVLRPLVDIKPDLLHPVVQRTVAEILADAPADVTNQGVVLL